VSDGCDDGNACTVDRCDPAIGCVSEPRVGLASVSCLCQGVPAACLGQPVPRGVLKRLTRSCGLVERAGLRTRRARRLLFDAAEAGARGRRAARRAGKHDKMTPACADALQRLFAELQSRSELVGGAL
jgi:hypothetical protein